MKFALLAPIAIAGCVLLSGFALSAEGRPSDPRAAATVSMQEPATPEELLQNIKLAIENGLLQHKNFYSEESLKRFFATSQIKWVGKDPEGEYPGIFAVVYALEEQPREQRCAIAVYPPGHGVKGDQRARLNFSLAPTPIEAMSKIFGTPIKVTDYGIGYREHPEPLDAKTHELGNSEIEYRFDQEAAKVVMITGGNGTVVTLNVWSEVK